MRVELYVDGKVVPMNRFVRSILKDVVIAVVSNLKGVEGWRRIKIEIERSLEN